MKNLFRFGLAGAMLLALAAFDHESAVKRPADRRNRRSGPYRVLAPIESGNLLLFPVVRASGKSPGATPFITLDEGIKSGDVEVTEAGKARGLVRHRGTRRRPALTTMTGFAALRIIRMTACAATRLTPWSSSITPINPSCCWPAKS